ncbi:hypothetical protein ABIC03_003446 [Bradyrhizobium sp. RT6a]|uniref:hypothetical protein n=1 Tax=unclassified Bradyrhizobium TaxID=2631580 RepID=UPI003398E38A
MSGDTIPKDGNHRGVELDDCQDEVRLVVVRGDIDRVFTEVDPKGLLKIINNPSWAPEARRFAAAKLEAVFAIAIDRREQRPQINLEYVRACVAGLDSVQWRDPHHYCSLLDRALCAPGGHEPVERARCR